MSGLANSIRLISSVPKPLFVASAAYQSPHRYAQDLLYLEERISVTLISLEQINGAKFNAVPWPFTLWHSRSEISGIYGGRGGGGRYVPGPRGFGPNTASNTDTDTGAGPDSQKVVTYVNIKVDNNFRTNIKLKGKAVDRTVTTKTTRKHKSILNHSPIGTHTIG